MKNTNTGLMIVRLGNYFALLMVLLLAMTYFSLIDLWPKFNEFAYGVIVYAGISSVIYHSIRSTVNQSAT